MLISIKGTNLRWILSYSAKEFIEQSSGLFLRRNERVQSLFHCNLYRAFGNTLLFQTRSSRYGDNHRTWHQYILLPNLKKIIQEQHVTVRRAIEIALEGDIKITCDCPSYLYNGFKYRSTREKYNYGMWRENRAPSKPLNIKASNRYLVCKHCVYVLQWIFDNLDVVTTSFENYFKQAKFNPDKYLSVDEENQVHETIKEAPDGSYEVSEDLPEPTYDVEKDESDTVEVEVPELEPDLESDVSDRELENDEVEDLDDNEEQEDEQ